MSSARSCRRQRRSAAALAVGGVCAALAGWPGAGRAQATAGGGISAAVGASLDAVELRRRGDSERGVVARLQPSVQLVNRSGTLQGQLSYAAVLQQRFGDNDGRDIEHTLAANFSSQPVEGVLFVDGSASVARSAISAFGTQTAASSSLIDDDNETDVVRATLRPSLRGRIGEVAAYNASVFGAINRSSESSTGDSDDRGADITVSSLGLSRVGWSLSANEQRTRFRAGRETVNQRLLASVTLRPDIDWQFTVRGGREATDVVSVAKRSYANYGVGARWQPSPRTSVSADVDERYFGRSWLVLAEYRTALSAFRLSTSRDASSSNGPLGIDGRTGNGLGTSQPVTLYQLFFNQLASAQPDPVLRDIQVRDFLRSLGLDPNAVVPGGFTQAGISVQRRADAGWTYAGGRLSLALLAYVSEVRLVDAVGTGQVGDGSVDQRGYTASAAWRLTPTATATVGGTLLGTSGNDNQRGNTLKSLTVTLSEQLALRTTASLNLRHTVQSGNADPYRENAIGASLSHRF